MPITTPTVTFDPTDRSYVERYDGAVIHTSVGDISLRFYGADAPMAVNNFLKLADAHFYDGTRFHRVIKGFMIQGGDPNSKDSDWSNDGIGGPGYKFNHEPNAHPIVRGSIAMANAGPNTNGSQFFILTAPNYAGPYTNFGEVTTGMQAVDTIEAARTNAADHPLEDLTITSIDLIEKK
jgi:peptidyl-prolyl cis-trans isomerase B (cyclophilin B)